MKHEYKIAITTKIDETGAVHTVYGVSVHRKNESAALRIVEDIFTDKTAAERFVDTCNILSLAPEHLDYVITDALCVQ